MGKISVYRPQQADKRDGYFLKGFDLPYPKITIYNRRK